MQDILAYRSTWLVFVWRNGKDRFIVIISSFFLSLFFLNQSVYAYNKLCRSVYIFVCLDNSLRQNKGEHSKTELIMIKF
jgi:hypothetical protein